MRMLVYVPKVGFIFTFLLVVFFSLYFDFQFYCWCPQPHGLIFIWLNIGFRFFSDISLYFFFNFRINLNTVLRVVNRVFASVLNLLCITERLDNMVIIHLPKTIIIASQNTYSLIPVQSPSL